MSLFNYGCMSIRKMSDDPFAPYMVDVVERKLTEKGSVPTLPKAFEMSRSIFWDSS